MNEVGLRYFHTKAGAEATVLLGRRELDRGRYNSATVIFRKFLERNQEDPVPVTVTFLAALSFKRLAIEASARNDKEEKDRNEKYAAEYWEKVKKEVGNGDVMFGTKKVTLDQLKAEFNRPIQLLVAANQNEWTRAFGNARNNAQGVGGRPFLDPTGQFSRRPILTKEDQDTRGTGMAWIEQNLKQFLQMFEQTPNTPPLPQYYPIASSGKIIFRTYDGIYCLVTRDDKTQNPPVKAGEMLWMLECENSLYKMVSNNVLRAHMDQQWKSFYMQQGPRGIFFEHGLNGSLSHDGAP